MPFDGKLYCGGVFDTFPPSLCGTTECDLQPAYGPNRRISLLVDRPARIWVCSNPLYRHSSKQNEGNG